MDSVHPFVVLLLQTTGMLVGTFLCGIVPIHLSLSKANLRIVEVLGAGLLIGASLTVVLPEGASAIFSAAFDRHNETQPPESWAWSAIQARSQRRHYDPPVGESNPATSIGVALLSGFLLMFLYVK